MKRGGALHTRRLNKARWCPLLPHRRQGHSHGEGPIPSGGVDGRWQRAGQRRQSKGKDRAHGQ